MKFLKVIVKTITVFAVLCIFGLTAIFAFIHFDKRKYVVPIMMYHSINYSPRQDALVTSPEIFEYHLAYFKENGYHVLDYDDFIAGLKSGKDIPKKSVVITFDDGYEDNYTYALPLLKKYGYPAIFFVPSDEVGGEGYLSWGQIRQMIEAGMDIGGHARNVDSYLPGKSTDELYEEIRGSRKKFQQKLNYSMRHFAYPIGGFNDEIKKIVKESGFQSACTTNRGFDRFNNDVYELNRVRLSDKDDKDYILWAKLTGYYNLLRKPKNPY